jgi:hypothetical protein
MTVGRGAAFYSMSWKQYIETAEYLASFRLSFWYRSSISDRDYGLLEWLF